MKHRLAILSLSALSLLLIAQTLLPFSLKLSKAYNDEEFNVEEEIQLFSKALLEASVLDSADLKDASAIYDKLQAELPYAKPEHYGIKKYIDERALAEIKKDKSILKANETDQARIALFTYYQLFSEKYCEFNLQVKEDRTVNFNNEHLPIASFESVLFEAIQNRIQNNVSVENAVMVISADPYTDTDFLSFIQKKLRELSLRKIKYTKTVKR